MGRGEKCITSWGMREHCMFLPVESLTLFSVSCQYDAQNDNLFTCMVYMWL